MPTKDGITLITKSKSFLLGAGVSKIVGEAIRRIFRGVSDYSVSKDCVKDHCFIDQGFHCDRLISAKGRASVMKLSQVLKASSITIALAFSFFYTGASFAAPSEGERLTNTASLNYSGLNTSLRSVATVTFTNLPGEGGDTPEPPTDIQLQCEVEPDCSGGLVIENVSGQVLGSLIVVDPNPTDTHTLTLTSSDDNLSFVIENGKLKLDEGISLDFESTGSIELTIEAVDSGGLSVTKTFPITVRDVNEAPFDIVSSNLYVVVGSPERRIGQLSATDVDVGDRLTFTVASDDRFTVLDGGLLALAPGVELEAFELIPLTITVTDESGLSHDQVLEVFTEPGFNPAPPADPEIVLMAPDSGGSEVNIPEATCLPSSGFVPEFASRALRVDLTPDSLAGARTLDAVDAYAIGDPIIVSVDDSQANLHPFELDRVDVLLEIDGTGDSEVLTLVETGLDTGVFVSFVFTTSQQSVANDCILTVASRNQVIAKYTNFLGQQSVSTLAEISPVGFVFNDLTGEPINGVVLSIINAETGEPAQIAGDGPSFAPFPAAVISGETIQDSNGLVYQNGPGEYRFPALGDGRYQLVIFNSQGWTFSDRPDSELQTIDTNQRALTNTSTGQYILSDASRGIEFQVSQGALPRIDIPIEPLAKQGAPVAPTSATIEFLQYSPNPAVGQSVNVAETTCVSGVSPSVVGLRGSDVPVPGVVNLAPATVYKAGEPIFVRVTDIDQNADSQRREQITIRLDVEASGDREFLQLTETETNSGVFVGYVQSTLGDSTTGSCMLGVVKDEPISTIYTDAFDQTDVASTLVQVDPFSRIFSTKDGGLVDGVTVTLLDANTGLAAEVFGDGPDFAPFPSTIVSGEQATDEAGLLYDFPTGSYRFPFVEPGRYQLVIDTIPAGLTFPSAATDTEIQSLNGAPFEIVSGSRGAQFEVAIGPALNIDVPLDQPLAEVFISKQASRDLVAIGDFVQYRLSIQNRIGGAVIGSQVRDVLPKGFRYQKNSLKINSIKVPDPEIGPDGRTLVFDLPTVTGAETDVSYVTEVTAGAETGEARNIATVVSDDIGSSNTAFASVLVRNDLFSEKAFLVGRVVVKQCEAQLDDSSASRGTTVEDSKVETGDKPSDTPNDVPNESAELQGVAGVRIYLEDGSYVVTDENGSWHMEGIEPGTHVVQMDTDSLQERYEASPCNNTSRFAGSPYSQFVDVQGGTLWRTNFEIQEKPAPESKIELEQTLKVDDEGIWVEIRAKNKGDVVVKDAKLIYSVPAGWEIVKGTEILDGAATSHQASIVGRIYQLGRLVEDKVLRLQIQPTDADLSQAVVPGENIAVVLRPRFATRSAVLSDSDKQQIDELLSSWRSTDWEQITIVGHSDNVPIAAKNRTEFADNKVLSEARAAAVARYIFDKVKVNKLVVVGAGEKYPIASNATRKGRAANRRVEFLLKPAPKKRRQQVVDASVLNGESYARLSYVSIGTPKGRTETSQLPLNRLVGGFDKLSSTVYGTAVGSWDLVENLNAPEAVARDPNVQGFVSIKDGARLGQAVQAVKFDLDSRLKPRLSLDGKEISHERIGFKQADDQTGKTLYSFIGVDFGEPGAHTLTVEGLDSFGNARFTESISVVRVGELHDIQLVSAQGNVADGRTPVRVQLKLQDKFGEPLGIESRVTLSNSQLKRDITGLSLTDLSKMTDVNFVDIDASGFVSFDPVSVSGTYPFTLSFNDFEEEFEVFVEAEQRDWIMVGLAEGSVAYNNISGNMTNAERAGLEDELDTDGRIAFYAKGQVKGEFVLTMAYDSAKERKNELEQRIDPNSFYTLYGDQSSTQFDASSQEKLFLKLEKDQFYALLGDFSTGLNGGELSVYSRSLSGIKSEYKGDTFEVVGFISETNQAFIKDEIRGDGTSGLYRLTRPGIIVNSEQISIQVRDRFRSQEILETLELRRHIDYNIDYDAGTVFFKEPIFSQDPAFNPQFIVVDYEVDSRGTDELNFGGRIAYNPTDALEVGVTLIREGIEQRESDLAAVDLKYEVTDSTEIRAEVAGTKSNTDGIESDGSAFLIEASHRSGNLDAQAYVREQEGSFGLGQQNESETGTRKIGVEARYDIAEGIEVAGELYRDSNLKSGTDLDVAATNLQYRADQYTLSTGVRTARTSGGTAGDQVSNQLLMGGSYQILDGRLVASANADTPIGGKGEAGDFPKRLRVGLDYKLTEDITLRAEQEFTWGDEEDTQGTRIGMSTRLWQGGELVTSVEQSDEENSQRLAAVAGLKQRWDLNENWSFDFGVDRSQTIKQKRKAPPALQVTTVFSSPDNDDFTSVTFGSKFRKDAWDWSTRVEYRDADTEDRMNLVSDVIHNLDEGQQLLAKLDVRTADSDVSESTSADIQLGYSYRPNDSRWTLFNRLDLQHSSAQNVGFDVTSQKIINNLNANYQWRDDTQIALQYGLKYVVDNFDQDEYRGFTDLYGMEVRHDLNQRWDVGVQGSLYNSHGADVSDYSYGVSVGYNMARNIWVSLGYNFDGFQDDDFSASEYTSEGLFLKYRVKFDQNTANSILGLMSE